MQIFKSIILTLLVLFIFQSRSNSQFVRQWTAREASSEKAGKSAGTALVVDDSGFAYVAGWTTKKLTGIDFLVARYSPYGELLWKQTF